MTDFEFQPHLIGKHVELRPMIEGDFEPLYRVAQDPLIWEQHPQPNRWQRAVFETFFRRGIESGGALVAIDRESEKVIGSSRYRMHDDPAMGLEIGWTFLARSHWGGVYNGDMKRLMLRHAFGCVDRVVFRIGAENIRSQRAVEKLGGVRTGIHVDDSGEESLVYAILRSTFM